MNRLFNIAVAIGVSFVSVIASSPALAQGVDEVVLWPAANATLHGNWIVTPDPTAAGGGRVQNPNASLAKVPASSSPADYLEMTFSADAQKPYRLWMRARAESNSWANDSVHVQFSGSVTAAGAPAFRIGTTSATTFTLEDCTGCGLSGWGWQDNGFGTAVMGPAIYFSKTGPQTIRIQRREDGIAIDQIVLSAERYFTSAPGAVTRDTVVLGESTAATSSTSTMPAGWQSTDIGAVGQPGSASENSGTVTVNGAGADVWGAADAFHYAHRTLTGDGSITAEVVSVEGAMAWTKMGVMIRATLAANSAHAFMLVSTSKGLAFQRRKATGGLTTNTAHAGTAPRWVRLTRAGTVITASVSADGRAWSVVGSDTFAGMPATVLVGLGASSHDTTRLATGTFANVTVTAASSGQPNIGDDPNAGSSNSTLQVSPNRRFLRDRNSGKPVFYFADTAWGIFRRLTRTEVDAYLQDCVDKGFNAIQAVALWQMASGRNAHGDAPLGMTNGKYDPTKIVTTPGNNPADAVAYDYWDHVDYVIDRAAAKGLYVGFEPTWGNYVSGTTTYAFDMSSNIFTVQNAKTYGEFLGRRYGNRPNIIWMLGGDRSAVYPNGDFRAVWRSMAEGIGRGVTGEPLVWNEPHPAWSQLLMTYHSQRRDDPGSAIWFHDDAWLSFNSTQIEYDEVLQNVPANWSAQPTKPILVIEARYEDSTSTDNIKFAGAFKQRYQLYQSFLAGSLGFGYGHTRIWDFRTTEKTWKMALNDPGRLAMKTFWRLLAGFSDAQLVNRVPDQTLIDGSVGTGTTEDLLVGMRDTGRKYAVVYSTNGRDIRLNAAKLAAGTADAFWFSPRTGRFHDNAGNVIAGAFGTLATGSGAPIKVFNPPGTAGADNDWVLKVVVR
jgi:hypothetical protein